MWCHHFQNELLVLPEKNINFNRYFDYADAIEFQKAKKTQKHSFANVPQNRCSSTFRKFHRKAPVLESLFDKVEVILGTAGPGVEDIHGVLF